MNKIVKNKGITLIALVITIIVLLILAAVSVTALTGENGIITKAIQSREKSAYSKAEEKIKLAVNGSYNEEAKIDSNLLKSNLNNIEGIKNQITDIIYPINIEIDGYKFTITDQGKISENKTNNYTTPILNSTDNDSNILQSGRDNTWNVNNLFDGVTNDIYSKCYFSSTGYIGYKFETDVLLTKIEINLYTNDANGTMKSFALKYSDDGITYQLLDYFNVDSSKYNTDETQTILITENIGKHKYWILSNLIRNDQNSSYNAGLNELKMYASTEDIATSIVKIPCITSANSNIIVQNYDSASWLPYNVFDRNTSSQLSKCYFAVNGGKIGYNFNEEIKLNKLEINLNTGDSNGTMKQFTLKYSDDGINYQTYNTYSVNASAYYNSNITITVELSNTTQKHRYWILTDFLRNDNLTDNAGINELQMIGER